MNPRADWARKGSAGFASTGFGASFQGPNGNGGVMPDSLAFSEVDDEELSGEDLAERYAICSPHVHHALLALNHNAVRSSYHSFIHAFIHSFF